MSGDDYCNVDCRYTHWQGFGHVVYGDIRRCEHGKIWQATGRTRENVYFSQLDVWERLGWWTPFAYRRALRALEEQR